jgi:hypothetical protein
MWLDDKADGEPQEPWSNWVKYRGSPLIAAGFTGVRYVVLPQYPKPEIVRSGDVT